MVGFNPWGVNYQAEELACFALSVKQIRASQIVGCRSGPIRYGAEENAKAATSSLPVPNI